VSFPEKFGRHGRFGEACEDHWRRWFKELGFAVFPMSWADRAGAPMFEADLFKVISPDLLVCRNGLSTLIDVKGKSICPRYCIAGRMQTGIEIRVHDAYWKIQDLSGQRVALAFLHADRTDVHLGYLDQITEDAQFRYDFDTPKWKDANPGHPFADKPMVFYNIDPNHGSRFEVMKIKQDLERWTELRRLAIPPKPKYPSELGRRRPCDGQSFLPGWD
jgi:hypothetical protein